MNENDCAKNINEANDEIFSDSEKPIEDSKEIMSTVEQEKPIDESDDKLNEEENHIIRDDVDFPKEDVVNINFFEINDKDLIKNTIGDSSRFDDIETDDELKISDTNMLKRHNNQYSLLLEAYVDDINNKRKSKEIFKWIFFMVSMALLIGVFILFIVLCFKKDDSLSIILSSFATLLTSIITLPQIIAKYLFNSEDEKNINTVIKNIQDYDLKVREEKRLQK